MKTHEVKGTEEVRQFITFAVGSEAYGLELLRVREVIRVRDITWLPKAPEFVRGIINLRGDVIPIVDLRQRFGLRSVEETGHTRVIVVEMEGRLTGLVVDSASQVARIPADQIDPPPPLLDGSSNAFITGVGKLESSLVVLLNPDAILTAGEKAVLSEIDPAATN